MFFTSSSFYTSCSSVDQFPENLPPSVAFWGRSNVGKSSLLNALVGATQARVSKEPGRTQLLNLFTTNNPNCTLVDLPGYGYAKISHQQAQKIGEMITTYLLSEHYPSLLMILIDSRHGLTVSDYQIFPLLQRFVGEIVFVATKCDKLSRNELQKKKLDIKSQLDVEGYSDCSLIFCSSEKKVGIDDLGRYICAHLEKINPIEPL